MDLLHVDFTSIKMIMELNRPPKVANVLVFLDHFTKYVMAYATPGQTTKTIAKFCTNNAAHEVCTMITYEPGQSSKDQDVTSWSLELWPGS